MSNYIFIFQLKEKPISNLPSKYYKCGFSNYNKYLKVGTTLF